MLPDNYTITTRCETLKDNERHDPHQMRVILRGCNESTPSEIDKLDTEGILTYGFVRDLSRLEFCHADVIILLNEKSTILHRQLSPYHMLIDRGQKCYRNGEGYNASEYFIRTMIGRKGMEMNGKRKSKGRAL